MGHGDRRLLKATEQAQLVVELWQQRPRWQRSPDHVELFYGWLLEHEPAVIPTGSGSFQKIQTVLIPHIVETR